MSSRGLYTLCWKLNPSQVESTSHWKSQSSTLVLQRLSKAWAFSSKSSIKPLLLENVHATALLSRVVNLVKEAVEHLNPNQTPVLTMDQPLSAIAKEIQWLWSDSFSNNKYVIMTRGWVWVGVGSSRWDGLECGWMVLGWPSAITTAGTVLQNLLWKHLILRGQDMPTSLQL